MPDLLYSIDPLITERATAEILGISADTLRRLGKRGEGPIRRTISPRRVGYKLSEVEAYRDRQPAARKSVKPEHPCRSESPGAA